ncbi:hypothetical protein niasHT_033239 [Heterodera trifolii]|uniref:Uncharacterized protein n=1 Tax=Heterodera trifolii TaxID=157864 RepID=A0ABD2J3A1_9BILA
MEKNEEWCECDDGKSVNDDETDKGRDERLNRRRNQPNNKRRGEKGKFMLVESVRDNAQSTRDSIRALRDITDLTVKQLDAKDLPPAWAPPVPSRAHFHDGYVFCALDNVVAAYGLGRHFRLAFTTNALDDGTVTLLAADPVYLPPKCKRMKVPKECFVRSVALSAFCQVISVLF